MSEQGVIDIPPVLLDLPKFKSGQSPVCIKFKDGATYSLQTTVAEFQDMQ